MRKAMSKLYGVQHHAADDIVAFELTTTASCAPAQHTLSRQERPLTRLLTVLQTFGISPLCCNVGRCSGVLNATMQLAQNTCFNLVASPR
jgi:hypothetical protein